MRLLTYVWKNPTSFIVASKANVKDITHYLNKWSKRHSTDVHLDCCQDQHHDQVVTDTCTDCCVRPSQTEINAEVVDKYRDLKESPITFGIFANMGA